MKYIPFGKTTAGFKGYSRNVAKQIGHQHTGRDSYRGYGVPRIAQNDGYAYKVYYPDNDFDWAAVHMLVETDDPMIEIEWIPIGHANAVSVKEGDFVREGQIVGYEGNHGAVYSGGRRVTVQERREGSKKGTHSHDQVRPVRKVENTKNGKHYLRNKDGSRYQGEDGYYREIIHDNDTRGTVNPMNYYPDNVVDRLELRAFDAAARGSKVEFLSFLAVTNLIRSFI